MLPPEAQGDVDEVIRYHSPSLPPYALEFVLWVRLGKGFPLLPVDQTISELCSVSSTDDGYNVFSIVETDYTDYIMFHLVNFNEEHPFQLMELYGRVFLH